MDFYEIKEAAKSYKFDEALKAKYALLGLGEVLLSDKGELVNLKAGRNGVLQIPDNCKIIKEDSINQSGANILKIGAGVEKCEHDIFYNTDKYEDKIDFEFDGTSAEIVSKVYLEYYFDTNKGRSNIKEVAIKVKSGLCEVLLGLIFTGLSTKIDVYGSFDTYVKEISKYFVSGSEFNICKDFTKEQAIEVLDTIAEYVEKNVDKSLQYSTVNAKYMAFGWVIRWFHISVENLLTKEENKFYDRVFGGV